MKFDFFFFFVLFLSKIYLEHKIFHSRIPSHPETNLKGRNLRKENVFLHFIRKGLIRFAEVLSI